MLLSRKYEEQLGEQAYREILSHGRLMPKSHPLKLNTHINTLVMSRAGARVGRMIEQKSNAPLMKWTFHVIESEEPNAFCLPGCKVFVHSDLFKIMSNEDTLAAVMFHEAAHGLDRYRAYEVTNRFDLDEIVKLAVDLPFSRKLELEADSIGLGLWRKRAMILAQVF
ncbi:hypothetical protein CCR75_005362 [Bremia lactucae]|uniref:Peptidase M48 domain-containing protein n=1 Tax=Bremia lactucae TaxID=4779 RepID=A0A976FFP9_BRELC|nr:hypothetical protein CCR75_005362 [Bremia lactucae]